ncbi:MarR family transcriptional regulator [Halorubellus sp. PRR65]|uniref:MarR family transcriptional regulator n=1 Tax=Halorubellus sp. PRR65 TaxID=3098148 RepID=UPI002B256E36|nr:MarR family transcriptional regulator [Halorubellus sp. PRR65]
MLTPRLLADNSDYARTTVREHLLELLDHGLVEYYDEDAAVYQLSDRGRAYLAGDLDVSELDDDA